MTEQEIIKKVEDYLDKIKMPYAKDEGMIRIMYNDKDKTREGNEKPLYTVSFSVPIFQEHKLYFMIIDGISYELLYIMTPHGYLEIKK